MFTAANPQVKPQTQRPHRRPALGYALLTVLIVGAVLSVIAFGMFGALRNEVGMSQASQIYDEAILAIRSGQERGLAQALLDPTIEGALPVAEFTAMQTWSITTQIAIDPTVGTHTISTTATCTTQPGNTQSASETFLQADIANRAALIP